VNPFLEEDKWLWDRSLTGRVESFTFAGQVHPSIEFVDLARVRTTSPII
jgi:hypothetical protein